MPGTLGTVRRDVVVDTGLGAAAGRRWWTAARCPPPPTAVDVAETVDSAAAVEFLVSRLASLDGRPAVSGQRGGCSWVDSTMPGAMSRSLRL